MKHEIFDSMKGQMNPSLQAQADLRQTLSKPAKARATDSRRWTALAACACLMLTICGAVALQNEASSPRQHSYTAVDGVFRPMAEQKNPIDGGGAEATTQTGSELPGGATVGGDAAVQAGAEAYDRLMQGMGMLEENAEYPDWYGGAYIDAGGGLTVLLVEDKDPGDKSLELQVLEWIDNAPVAFTSAKYSRAHLEELSREIAALLDGTGVFASAGINEVENRVDLDLSVQADDKLLSALVKLDPDDDAIRVNVYTQPVEEIPYQKGPAQVKLGEEPVPGGNVDGNPHRYEAPTYKTAPAELPTEQSAPAHYDLLPLEE